MVTLDADRVVAVLAQLYGELHPQDPALQIGPSSRLDRDLGLDSVSRLELLERLERAFSVHFSEESVLRAATVSELVEALGTRFSAPGQVGALPVPTEPSERVRDDLESLVQVLAWHAQAHPQRVHAQFVGEGSAQELRYGELYESARLIAAGLHERGVARGDRVALMLPTGADYLRCFSAILLLGAVPVPVYPPSRPALLEEHLVRQQGILDNAQVVALITMPEALPIARAMKRLVASLRFIADVAGLRTDASLPACAPRADDLALLQYTSGSTGDPKGVMLSHRNLLANIRAMGRAVEITTTDVMVSWLPLYHDMGLIGGWLAGLYFGFPVVLMSPTYFLGGPARWLRVIHEVCGTLSCAPNFAYELCVRRIADADLHGIDLSRWRFALNGSEPVSAHTVEAFCARLAPYGFRRGALTPAYGLAECAVALAFPPLMRGPRIDWVLREPLVHRDRALPAPSGADPAGTVALVGCGHALAGHELRVVDALGHECADRELGDIEFRGPSATRGYFGRPEETQALFHGDWLRTGDIGYIADGELFVTGRRKDMIIRAGQHVFPQEIEELVGELDGVRRGCVAAIASLDPRARTEQLVIVAETRHTDPSARSALSAQISARVAALLGTPPEVVVLVPPHSVPKTSSGKLRRSACRRAYEHGTLGTAPRHPWLQLARADTRAAISGWQRAARSLASLGYGAYAWLSFGVVAVIAWSVVLVLPRLAWRLSFARAAARWLAWLTRTPWAAHGLERLPTGAFLIVANHQSNIDPFVLVGALPVGVRIVAKSELARHWWTRVPLDRLGVEYVERRVTSAAVSDARRILEQAHAGRTLLFFPEGTHARTPGLLPFHTGAFVTAARASLPVLPIAITGTRSILRSDTWLPRRGKIEVVIGDPLLPTGTDFDAALRLSRAARAFILAQTGEPDLA